MNRIRAQRIDHVAIDVTNVDRAKTFYSGVLGLEEIPRPPSFDFGGAWYQIGPEVLHLVSRPQEFAEAPHHFCLWVEDIEKAAAVIESAGYTLTWDTRYKIAGIDRFFVRDPDRNRVEFQGPERRRGHLR
jgi:glyoxylase I family protein